MRITKYSNGKHGIYITRSLIMTTISISRSKKNVNINCVLLSIDINVFN